MRRLVPLVLLAAGCGRPTPAADPPAADPSEPVARVRPGGRVHGGRFSADGNGFVGYVVPAGKDPSEVARNPRDYVLWDVTAGRERARQTLDVIDELLLPGAADGGEWLTHENQPPVFVSKYRFLDLRTGARTDPPGVADPKKTCTPPSFSADRSRLAYSDYEDPRRGHVYERAAGGWRELAAVPGENARLSPDGKSVATVGWAGGERASHLEVGLYTVPDGKKRWAARVDSYGLRGFTPDGRFVVQDDNAGRRLLDAATGRPTLALKTGRVAYHAGHVLALDPGGAAQPLTRWDAATGQELSRVGLAQTAADRDRTPPFGSPRLAVVRAWDRPASPADPARASVLGVTVRDPARPDWKAEFELTGAAEVLLLPDGKTLAAVESDGVSFYRLPD